MLIPFPVAFFIGTFLCDLFSLILKADDFRVTARILNLGGITFALIAAIPGIIDYRFTVPPKSSAKKRATRHALLNVTVVVLFILALLLRSDGEDISYFILGAEAVGVILLSIAGWMGGTLVYRNQIGVDPRYAHAGKWKEEFLNKYDETVEVAKADELKINQMKLLHISEKRIVLCRTEEGYAAFDDRCTHRGGSLAGGALICGTVQCPWHGSQFSVKDGTVKAGPATEGIVTYPVIVNQEKVFVTISRSISLPQR
jgi:nitrite reductase/ring-hydroxylating ferredoxin subunit/uncharacterized membrane protein